MNCLLPRCVIHSGHVDILLSDIRNLARGGIVGREVDAVIQRAADYHASLERLSRIWLAVAVVAIIVTAINAYAGQIPTG